MILTQRIQYKQKIIDRLLSSPAVVEALTKDGEPAAPESARQHIFPYRFIQFPTQEPDCYISVDVVTAKSGTASIRTRQLFVWICCHKGLFSGDA